MFVSSFQSGSPPGLVGNVHGLGVVNFSGSVVSSGRVLPLGVAPLGVSPLGVVVRRGLVGLVRSDCEAIW